MLYSAAVETGEVSQVSFTTSVYNHGKSQSYLLGDQLEAISNIARNFVEMFEFKAASTTVALCRERTFFFFELEKF
jgi:hypothetical protein